MKVLLATAASITVALKVKRDRQVARKAYPDKVGSTAKCQNLLKLKEDWERAGKQRRPAHRPQDVGDTRVKTAAASNASTACRVRGIVVLLTFCWCLVAESVVRVLGSCQNYFGEVDIPALVCNLGANRIRQAARTLGFVSGCFGSCRSEKEVTSAVGGAGRRSEGRAELRRHNSIQTSDG